MMPMLLLPMLFGLVLLLLSCSSGLPADGDMLMEVHMPGVHTQKPDEYVCKAVRMPAETHYLVKFEVLADAARAHHLLVYACDRPVNAHREWSQCFATCAGASAIIFGWGKNAPPMALPTDVGFAVGGASSAFLVVQIHYLVALPDSGPGDTSGIRFTLTKKKPEYAAGILLMLLNYLRIAPGKKEVIGKMSCQYNGESEIHPFAFRTHAHALSTIISGFQYNGSYHLIGKGSPQWPQSFYPTPDKTVVVRPGDKLVGACIYDSTSQRTMTMIGHTHDAEMCNFYVMYYYKPGPSSDRPSPDPVTCSGNQFPAAADGMPPAYRVAPTPPPGVAPMPHHHGRHREEEGEIQRAAPLLVERRNWLADLPVALGQVGGLAVDSRGHVHIFHRADRVWRPDTFDVYDRLREPSAVAGDVVVEVSGGGELVRHWGGGAFYVPHGASVDSDDNLWLTDVGAHMVYKFAPGASKPSLALGQLLKPGYDDSHFCKPTDVAVLPDGSFFVSDGYCNNRLVHFGSDGKFFAEFGGNLPSVVPSSLLVPHSLTVLPSRGWVCVADRENGRVVCFDFDRKLRKVYKPAGVGKKIFAVTYCPDLDVLLMVNGGDTPVSGSVVNVTSGSPVEMFDTEDGMQVPHDIASRGGSVYVGEISRSADLKVVKFAMRNGSKIHSQKQATEQPAVKDEAHPSHPIAIDSGKGDTEENKIDKNLENETNFQVSLLIGGLVIIPVAIFIIGTVIVRARRQVFSLSRSGNNRRFNLAAGLLGRKDRTGFQSLSTDGSDGELDNLYQDDSDSLVIVNKNGHA